MLLKIWKVMKVFLILILFLFACLCVISANASQNTPEMSRSFAVMGTFFLGLVVNYMGTPVR